MQLDEATEKAFQAGIEWTLENCYCKDRGGYSDAYVELDRSMYEGYQEYINGNSKSTESAAVLDKGSSQTAK